MIRLALVLYLLLLAAPAWASGPTSESVCGAVTGSASMIACSQGAAHQRTFLAIDNESASDTIACSFIGTAALNSAGSWTIPPMNTRTWAGSAVPYGAINCISSGTSTPISVEEE